MIVKRVILSLGIIVGTGTATLAEGSDYVTGHWNGAVTRDGAVQSAQCFL